MERDVEGAVFDENRPVARVLDPPGDGVAVARSPGQCLEDEGVEGALEEVEIGHSSFPGNGSGELDARRGDGSIDGMVPGNVDGLAHVDRIEMARTDRDALRHPTPDRTLSADPASNPQHVTRSVVALQTAYQVSEPDLIARVLAGDRIAARELYDAHSPRVFRLAFRLTGDADLAREFTQDTFVRAFGQLAKFRGDSALSTWLHRITVTVVANAMRKVKRFRERETDLEDVHPIGSDGAGVDPVLRERLHRAIDDLPEIYRTTRHHARHRRLYPHRDRRSPRRR